MWKARLDPATTFRATASYVPSRADVWGSDGVFRGADALFVTDGFASDRFVAVELERAASPATVSVRVAHGRAQGALAPAWDGDLPVVMLADRSLEYGAARFGVTVPRAGSSISLEYRSLRNDAAAPGIEGDETLKTLQLDFAQSLVRFAGGRASCRLLVTARSAKGSGLAAAENELADARRYVAGHKRVAAGVSLAF